MNSISCVKALLYDKSGRVLVLRRSKTHPKYPLFLDLPGGEVEAGEIIEQALIREIKEETGLEVKIDTAVLLNAETHVREQGDSMTYLLYKVAVEESQIEVALSWEHIEHLWLKPDELRGFEQAFQEKIDYVLQHELI